MNHSFYLLLCMGLVLALSACQNEPKLTNTCSMAELIASGNEAGSSTEEGSDGAESNAVSTIRDQTSLTYRDTWTAGNLTWVIDAEVVVPDRENMPMVSGNWQEEHLYSELVDRVITVLFGDRDYYSFDIDSDLVNGYNEFVPIEFRGTEQLESIRREMAELENYRSQFSNEEYERIWNDLSSSVDTIRNRFQSIDYDNMLKNQYVIAKSIYPDHDGEIALDEVEVYSPNKDGLCDRLEIKTSLFNQKRNYVTFSSNDLQHDYCISEEEMSFSRNQAIQKCEDYLQALDIDFLEVQEIRFAYGYYQVVFCLKENDGVPAIPWLSSDESLLLSASPSVRAYYSAQQNATIWLDEDHVVYLSLPLSEPVMEVTGNWSELVTFDEMISDMKNSFAEVVEHHQNQGLDTSISYINKIYLTNTYVQTTPLGSPYEERIFQSIPVWVFTGDFKENRQLWDLSAINYIKLNADEGNEPEIYACCLACRPEEVNFTELDLSAEEDSLINQTNAFWYRREGCFYCIR